MEPELREQNIGEVDLQYLFYQGTGPTILMLHATGFLPWLWHPVAKNLAPSFTVMAPYFCDHRVTEPEEGGLNWITLAEDIARLCEELHIEAPLLVGHSMGATVLTIADALHDIGAGGIILIEPIFLPRDFYGIELRIEDHPLASKSIRRKNHWGDREEALSYLRSRPLFKEWDEEMLEIYLEHGMSPAETGGLELTCSPAREASLFMGGIHYDPWPIISKIECPVLVLEGEKSENRSYIDLKKAASLFPRGTHMLIPGAGHLIPMEQPGKITDIIITYFKDL